MKIEFILPKHNIISKSFCNYVVRWVRRDLSKHTNMSALQLRLDTLLDINFVEWEQKPDHIAAKLILKEILQNIEWVRFRNRYIVRINPSAYFPNSKTKLELVVRYINYGSLNVRGCFFISNIFLRYQESIYRYWALYRAKLRR